MGPDEPLGTRTMTITLADHPAPDFVPMLNVNPIDPLAPVPTLSEDPFQHQPPALPTTPTIIIYFPCTLPPPLADHVLTIEYVQVRQTSIRTAIASHPVPDVTPSITTPISSTLSREPAAKKQKKGPVKYKCTHQGCDYETDRMIFSST